MMASLPLPAALGGNPEATYALPGAVSKELLRGPRIFAEGSERVATAGHGGVDGVKPELLKLWTPETICDGPYECRKATRNVIKMSDDWIKITAAGGFCQIPLLAQTSK
jgi:imidazolonepropionase-like amidohydrolase